MTVILNDAAITKLFEAPGGPVARFVEREAEKVALQAQNQFDRYFHIVLPLGRDIGVSMDGSSATIGYVNNPGNPKARRLAEAEAAGKLTDPPLQLALERIRAGSGL